MARPDQGARSMHTTVSRLEELNADLAKAFEAGCVSAAPAVRVALQLYLDPRGVQKPQGADTHSSGLRCWQVKNG